MSSKNHRRKKRKKNKAKASVNEKDRDRNAAIKEETDAAIATIADVFETDIYEPSKIVGNVPVDRINKTKRWSRFWRNKEAAKHEPI